jgi:hypothetical protein
MKKLLLALLLTISLTACKQNSHFETDNHVYTMDLYLDTDTDQLEVEGELSYMNTMEELDELYLHVYPNAINLSDRSYNMDFEYLRINGVDMDITFEGTDSTLMHFEFDQSFSQNERIDIDFKYRFDYWEDDRLIVIDDYYVTMFFYPYVPVFDDTGWNTEPYSFRGESYFNDIGDYYVTINVPEEYKVAASGGIVAEKTRKGRTVLEYEVLNARDFSFSASSEYHVYSRDDNGRTYRIYSYDQLPEYLQEQYFDYVLTTFRFMERDIGPYEYNHFSLELGYIYGMESTGVVYCSKDVDEGTIAHEIIHQWFYSVVGNDQTDEPFVDEALVTFFTAFFFEELYGEQGYNGYLDYRSSLKDDLSDRFTQYQGDTILQRLFDYGDGYGYLVYYHGPTIYRYYIDYFLDGDTERFKEAISSYYQTYKYDEVSVEELFTFLEEELDVPGTKEWLYEQANDVQDLENENPFE